MGALPPVPNVLRIAQEGVLGGIPIATIWHLGYQGNPPSGSQCLNVAQKAQAAWNVEIAPLQVTACVYQLWTVTDLSSETGAEALFEASTPGQVTGQPDVNNVQLVVSKAIARRYRGGHPRTYLPGMPTNDLLDGAHWLASKATAAGNGWANMVNQTILNATQMALTNEVVVHYVKNKLPLPAPLVDGIIGAVGNTLVGTLRRRLT